MLTVRLKKRAPRRALSGYPWVYAGELETTSEHETAGPGAAALLEAHDGRFIARGYYNPHSAIACRLLSWKKNEQINAAFFAARAAKALELRAARFSAPFYRLIHAEADGLPGLTVDRFGDTLVCQFTTAGMERLRPLALDALDAVIKPRAILLRNDTPARQKEGLAEEVLMAKGNLADYAAVEENGMAYFADLKGGQKTGWFFDQREERAFIASLSCGATVLDAYCYAGGFGLAAAKAGAAAVTFLDSSGPALAMARKTAEFHGFSGLCSFIEAKAYQEMERMARAGSRFGVVISDPPAFVKSRRDAAAGLRGYRKLAKLSAGLIMPGGIFFIASCSHHARREEFLAAAWEGISDAGRRGELLRCEGAAADHPVHPLLPETCYLKAAAFRLG